MKTRYRVCRERRAVHPSPLRYDATRSPSAVEPLAFCMAWTRCNGATRSPRTRTGRILGQSDGIGSDVFTYVRICSLMFAYVRINRKEVAQMPSGSSPLVCTQVSGSGFRVSSQGQHWRDFALKAGRWHESQDKICNVIFFGNRLEVTKVTIVTEIPTGKIPRRRRLDISNRYLPCLDSCRQRAGKKSK